MKIKMHMAMMITFLIASISSFAQEEVDHLKLASMLVQNGHYARASAELDRVEKEQRKEQSIAFWTARGLVDLNGKEYSKAKVAFEKAQKAVRKDEDLEKKQKQKKKLALDLYLIQCQYGLEQYEDVVSRIDASPKVLKKNLAWSLKVASLWALNKKHQAWDVLDQASIRFSKDSSFLLQKVNYLVELGLFNEAFVLGKAATRSFTFSSMDWLRLGGRFKSMKRFDEALWFFEMGVLLFPSAELLSVELAHTYTLKGMNLTAAGIFEKLALRKPKYFSDVAELYRQEGKLLRAEYFNGMVEDQQKKFRQRFSLALGQKNFTKAESMKPTLSRLGLLEDQNLVYAFAFAHFQNGNFSPAKKMLSKITDAGLFEKVVALQSTIGECEEKPWECEQ